MEDTLYYTLSTIAQVLAAIVGIIGVFAIFRFQFYTDSLYGFALRFHERVINTELVKNNKFLKKVHALKDAIAFKKDNEIDNAMSQIETFLIDKEDYTNIYQKLFELHTRFKMLKSNVINKSKILKEVFIYSLALIVMCLIILSFTDIICKTLAYILLGLCILATIVCLYKIFSFISITLK